MQEVVTDAIRQAFEGQLEIQQNLHPTIASTETGSPTRLVDTYPELADYIGGIRLETTLQTACNPGGDRSASEGTSVPARHAGPRLVSLRRVRARPQDPRAQPAGQCIHLRQHRARRPACGSSAKRNGSSSSTTRKRRILLATQRETSLPRVTQIDPFVGSEAKTRALISDRPVAGGHRRLHLAAIRQSAVRTGGHRLPVPRRVDRPGRHRHLGLRGRLLPGSGPADQRFPHQRRP